jgi:hypothetical protein
LRPLRRAAYSRAIVAQMKAALVSRQLSPSFERSSGSQNRSNVRRPESEVSHSPTGTRSRRRQSAIRAA